MIESKTVFFPVMLFQQYIIALAAPVITLITKQGIHFAKFIETHLQGLPFFLSPSLIFSWPLSAKYHSQNADKSERNSIIYHLIPIDSTKYRSGTVNQSDTPAAS